MVCKVYHLGYVCACVHVSVPQFLLSNFARVLAGCFSPEMERGVTTNSYTGIAHSLYKSVGSAGWRCGKDEKIKRKHKMEEDKFSL